MMGGAQLASLACFPSPVLHSACFRMVCPEMQGCAVGYPGAVCILMVILPPQEGLPHVERILYSGDFM